MIISEILVPLLNANEPEAHLVDIHVKEGQPVVKGTLLFTIETTKAASDIESQGTGYIRIFVKGDEMLAVGDKLAVITESADEPLETKPDKKVTVKTGSQRITKPALRLAESLGVDLSSLPPDRLVTEAVVRQYAPLKKTMEVELPPSEKPYLLIFGGGGHAKSLMEMIKLMGEYAIAGIVDDKLPAGTLVLGIPVLGSRALLPELIAQGVKLTANGVGGILDINVRVRIFELLAAAGFSFPVLLHPRATVEPSAKIGEGVQVFANAYIGADALLEPRCMVNTSAIISHDCIIGAYTHIAPGALLAGHVHIGERSLIGMGVTVHIGVQIGKGVRIGNGAIVLADVPDKTIIQAGRYWTGKAETPG
jgi:sugar O-acyltransferase (sialic acid O-acetyltransferase NeuD family)